MVVVEVTVDVTSAAALVVVVAAAVVVVAAVAVAVLLVVVLLLLILFFHNGSIDLVWAAFGTESSDPGAVPRGPRFVIEPQSVVVVGRADSAFLECVAVSNPPATYTW